MKSVLIAVPLLFSTAAQALPLPAECTWSLMNMDSRNFAEDRDPFSRLSRAENEYIFRQIRPLETHAYYDRAGVDQDNSSGFTEAPYVEPSSTEPVDSEVPTSDEDGE